MQPTTMSENWQTFYDSARHNEILDERTTVMLHLASAIGIFLASGVKPFAGPTVS